MISISKMNQRGVSQMIAIGIVVVVIVVVGGVFVAKHKSTPADANACVHKTLSIGSNGHCVSDAQNLLNWSVYGINGPSYMKIDGQYTTAVSAVTKKFQGQASLPQTGNVSPSDWKNLCQGSDTPPSWVAAAKDAGC